MASSGKRKRNDDNKDANDLTVDGKNTISVKTYDRGTFSLQVKGSDTIISVKLKIRNMTKIPHDKQALIFNGMVLEGDLITLADYRVKKDSTLTLMRKSSGLVPIIIDCPTGKFRFSMNVELSNTIGKLKAKIPYRVWYLLASKPHDKCKDLVIVSNGIVLDDCCILADFHIKMDSVLTLMHTSTSKTMEIFVKTPAGKTISRDVIATTTIGEVKTAIRWEVDIPEDEQVIIFNEMVLDDSSVVFDFGIKKGSTLTVMRVSKGLMEIFVNIENGKSISFKVKTSDTIGNLKTQISDKVGIPIDKQVLIFNEIILHDCGTFADFDIKTESTLTLQSPGLMQIFVNTVNGKSTSVEVKPSETIGNLKSQISDKVGIPIDKQVLIFNEMVLDDSGTLADFHIKTESTLTLMRKSRGSMEIFVQDVLRNKISLEVNPLHTIGNLKDRLLEEQGIMPEMYKLFFKARELEDDRTYADYNIQKGNVIHQELTIRSGPSLFNWPSTMK